MSLSHPGSAFWSQLQHASHVARQRPRKSSGRRPTNIGCTRTAALPVLATILHNTVLYVMSHVGKNNHTDTMPYITNNTTIYVGWPIWALPDTLSGQFYGLSCQTQWLDINQCGLCLKSWWKFWCWGEGVEEWIWSWYGAFLPKNADDILYIHWIHCIHYIMSQPVVWTRWLYGQKIILGGCWYWHRQLVYWVVGWPLPAKRLDINQCIDGAQLITTSTDDHAQICRSQTPASKYLKCLSGECGRSTAGQ